MAATDAQLIRRAREDPEALAELYLRYRTQLYAWFRARLPESAASELTAELFAQVALSLKRFRDEANGSAAPWLYGIARNLLRRYYERGRIDEAARRRLGMPVRSYEFDFEAIEDRLAAGELRGELESALESLPKEQRDALVAGEPEKFFPPSKADERYQWVQAWLAALDEEEMRELVTDAWRMCVPKKVRAEYDLRSGLAPRE